MDRDSKLLFRKKVLNLTAKKRVNNYKKDKLIIERLKNYIQNSNLQDIMLFLPLKNEVNIMPLIKLLRERGYNLYVPYMEGESFRPVKYRLPLFKKKFNIKEPKNSLRRVKKIDLAIVPILGIDKSFRRVGYGKGMYDRFFAKEGKKVKKTLFLERDIYYSSQIITDFFDIKADLLCTNSFIRV